MLPEEEQTIREWAARQTATCRLLLARAGGEADGRLARFSEHLQSLAPSLQLKTAGDEAFRSPALIVGRQGNIAFQAVPAGKALKPFLHALGSASGPATGRTPEWLDQARRIELPADLSVYIAPACPHCPAAVAQLIALADAIPHLRLTVIDATFLADQAAAHGIRSVPTVMLDDRIRWTGSIDMDEIVMQCIQRDPILLSKASLRQIIEAGDAARVAGMMADHGRIFPAIIELLTDERWSIRLGAMVTAEYLADQAPGLAAGLIRPLWEKFRKLSEPVQGDVVQVFAQIGNGPAVDCLRRIMAGDFPDSVREAASEEIESRPER